MPYRKRIEPSKAAQCTLDIANKIQMLGHLGSSIAGAIKGIAVTQVSVHACVDDRQCSRQRWLRNTNSSHKAARREGFYCQRTSFHGKQLIK